MDFSNFFILYVFDVKESVYRSFTRPIFLGDLEIPGQLPVLQELEGTDGWVLWIFVNSLFPTFSRSRNLFSRSFTKLPCSGDLENPCQLPVSEDWYSKVLSIESYGFQFFLPSLRFRCQGICFS